MEDILEQASRPVVSEASQLRRNSVYIPARSELSSARHASLKAFSGAACGVCASARSPATARFLAKDWSVMRARAGAQPDAVDQREARRQGRGRVKVMGEGVHEELRAFADEISVERLALSDLLAGEFALGERLLRHPGSRDARRAADERAQHARKALTSVVSLSPSRGPG
jgi:hypothetical protein